MVTTTANESRLAEREPTKVYRLNGISYLPTYTGNRYVGPGYPVHAPREWTANELLLAGAHPAMELLWPRFRRRETPNV